MAFFKSALTTFFFRIFVIISSISFGIIIARELGPEGRGSWALLVLNFVLLTLVSNLGTPQSSIFFIGTKKFDKVAILSSLMIFTTGSGIILIAINAVLYFLGWNILFMEVTSKIFWLSMILIIPLGINTQIRHFLLGTKKIVLYNILNAFESCVLLIFVLTLLVTENVTLLNVVLAYVLMTFINFTLHLILVRKEVVEAWKKREFEFKIIKATVKNGLAYFFTGMGGFWSQRLNIFLIELTSSVATVGLYTVALAFPNLIANIPNQIGVLLYPYVSGEKDEAFNYKFTALIVKLSLLLTIIIAIPLLIFGSEILLFVYGGEFSGLQNALSILIFAMLLEGTGALVFNHFAGLGKPIYGTYQFIISISFSLLFGLILIPKYGLEGAAISKLIAAFGSVSFIVYKFSKKHSVLSLLIPMKEDLVIFKKVLSKG